MKLSEYVEALTLITKEYPDATVIYSNDDEGNVFKEVCYSPTVGNFNNGEWNPGVKKVNAVCIN